MPDPIVGERRTFDGTLAEWDGHGWAAVTGDAPSPRSWMDTATDALPMITGTIGGLAGGIPGAALGGAAGQGFRDLAQHAREIPGAVADVARNLVDQPAATLQGAVQGMGQGVKDAGIQGVEQGALEGVGIGATKVASNVGHGLMDLAVRPTETLAGQFGGRTAMIDNLVTQRLPVGSVMNRASGRQQAARQLMGQSRTLRQLLARAEAGGTRFSASEVLDPVRELIDSVAKEPLPESGMQQLDGMIGEFLRNHPGPLTPTAVKDLKQAAQQIAQPLYRAQQRGEVVPAAESVRGRFNQAVASGAKSSLETIDQVGATEGKKQALIGSVKALRKAEARRLPLAGEIAAGTAPVVISLLRPQSDLPADLRQAATAYLITRGLASPRLLSRGALTLTNAQVQGLLREVPRLAAFVYDETVSKDQEGQ